MQIYDEDIGRYVDQIDEMFIIPDLRKYSSEFKHFYNEERMKKLGEISWRLDNGLEDARMKSTTKLINNINFPIIYFKDFPISVEDVCIVAHEIMHCILVEEGRSINLHIEDKSNKDLAGSLKTLIEDTIINPILQNDYKINLSKTFKKDIEFAKDLIEVRHDEPKDHLLLVQSAFNIATHMLRYDRNIDQNVDKNIDEDVMNCWDTIQVKIEEWYPTISKMSKDVVSIIQKKGLDTPEKSKIACKKIIEECDINDIISIK